MQVPNPAVIQSPFDNLRELGGIAMRDPYSTPVIRPGKDVPPPYPDPVGDAAAAHVDNARNQEHLKNKVRDVMNGAIKHKAVGIDGRMQWR